LVLRFHSTSSSSPEQAVGACDPHGLAPPCTQPTERTWPRRVVRITRGDLAHFADREQGNTFVAPARAFRRVMTPLAHISHFAQHRRAAAPCLRGRGKLTRRYCSRIHMRTMVIEPHLWVGASNGARSASREWMARSAGRFAVITEWARGGHGSALFLSMAWDLRGVVGMRLGGRLLIVRGLSPLLMVMAVIMMFVIVGCAIMVMLISLPMTVAWRVICEPVRFLPGSRGWCTGVHGSRALQNFPRARRRRNHLCRAIFQNRRQCPSEWW